MCPTIELLLGIPCVALLYIRNSIQPSITFLKDFTDSHRNLSVKIRGICEIILPLSLQSYPDSYRDQI